MSAIEKQNKVLVVIPARYESSRFPGKALADLHGRPLIVRTAEAAAGIQSADTVVVATDDARIADVVSNAGYACELTGRHETGTDRVGEVAARHEADIVLNLQGDEPLLDPRDADAMVAALRADAAADIVTCGHAFAGGDLWRDPNAVKVVTDRHGRALYFSRAAIPGIFPGSADVGWTVALRHVGLYAFRRRALEQFLRWERTPLEIAEGLEQLRALENGLCIRVVPIERVPIGVDTPEDLAEVRRLWTASDRKR